MFPSITHDDVYRIETPRLWLRWPQLADAPAIADFARHKQVAQMTASIPHPYPAHQAFDFVRTTRMSNQSGPTLELLIVLKGQIQKVIGTVLLRFAVAANEQDNAQTMTLQPMIGYALHPDHWGFGYASEACRAIIEAVFTLTSITGITATVRIENAASIHILEKLGFNRQQERTSYAPLRGLPYQVFDYRLDRDAWRGLSGEAILPLDLIKPYQWTDWVGAA
jgi:ribosomal protein S18 acetylase RimI-like enzyme